MKKVVFGFILLFGHFSVFGDIISITRGNTDPIYFALNDFELGHGGVELLKFRDDILNVIRNDLNSTGILRSIPNASFIENKTGVSHIPLFAAWDQINANLLINGSISDAGRDSITLNFVLWDILLEKKIIEYKFRVSKTYWRRIAHNISNKIYQSVTGCRGYFDDKVVYVAEIGPYLKRKKRIAIMDQDGANHTYLTSDRDIFFKPRFSPKGDKIIYSSYKGKILQLYMLNLNNNRNELLVRGLGKSFAPVFSPDGNYVSFSIAKDGKTHIYEMNLSNKKIKRLTDGDHIDTSPSYSPDGKRIVFSSDRLGKSHLFVMNRDGSDVRQYTTNNNGIKYFEPRWHNNDYIVFTKITHLREFLIGALNEKNPSDEILITSGYLVESPVWVNDRVIVYSRGNKPSGNNQKNLNKIYMIDFISYNQHMLNTPHDSTDPDWLRRDLDLSEER